MKIPIGALLACALVQPLGCSHQGKAPLYGSDVGSFDKDKASGGQPGAAPSAPASPAPSAPASATASANTDQEGPSYGGTNTSGATGGTNASGGTSSGTTDGTSSGATDGTGATGASGNVGGTSP